MSTDESPAILEVRGVTKTFGRTVALDDVDLTVGSGRTHGLMGRNGAGKSTLIAVLAGVLAPDVGTVLLDGRAVPPSALLRSDDAVACVYQHPRLLPDLSVAENLALGRRSSHRLVRWRGVRERAERILDEWDVPVSARTLARQLTVEQRQLVEIARALSRGHRLVLLDEPTAQLDRKASQRLFARMRTLQAQGLTFLFISHHLHELYDVCDDVTVLRDGRRIVTAAVADLPSDQLVRAMVGDTHGALPHEPRQHEPGRPSRTEPGAGAAATRSGALLRLRELSLGGAYHDVTLSVWPGEIVALAGLAPSGKSQVADTVVGLLRADSGSVEIDGEPLRPGSVPPALRAGVGYVPEDRHARGFAPQLSIAENLTTTLRSMSDGNAWRRHGERRRAAADLAEHLDIVPRDLRTPVQSLSGGNQQKVVMGRALATDPRVLVLVNPTAGVDVASKALLYAAVKQARGNGAAILLVTDEAAELRLADTVVVLYKGRVRAAFQAPVPMPEVVAAIEGVEDEADIAAAGAGSGHSRNGPPVRRPTPRLQPVRAEFVHTHDRER